jgi:hypothetical protein
MVMEMIATFHKLNDKVSLSQFYEGRWGKRCLPSFILILSTRKQVEKLMTWLLCPHIDQKAG